MRGVATKPCIGVAEQEADDLQPIWDQIDAAQQAAGRGGACFHSGNGGRRDGVRDHGIADLTAADGLSEINESWASSPGA